MDFINRAAAIWSKSATAFPFNFEPKNQKNIDREGLWAICDGTKRVLSLFLSASENPPTFLSPEIVLTKSCPRSSEKNSAEM
jgi:hypothetical protein